MINEDCIDLSVLDNDLVYEDDIWEQFTDDEINNKEFIEAMKELKSNDIDSPVLEKLLGLEE